jgi:hypothetical protein
MYRSDSAAIRVFVFSLGRYRRCAEMRDNNFVHLTRIMGMHVWATRTHDVWRGAGEDRVLPQKRAAMMGGGEAMQDGAGSSKTQ